MRVGVPKETASGEQRVALVPDAVARLEGFTVVVERGAGRGGRFPGCGLRRGGRRARRRRLDRSRRGRQGGRRRARARSARLQLRPGPRRLPAAADRDRANRRAARGGVLAFAMESIPRTTRAQAMDALSSQATVAGYKAVLIGADRLPRFLPMLTTAAGTIPPARVARARRRRRRAAGDRDGPPARRASSRASTSAPPCASRCSRSGRRFLDLGVVGEETRGRLRPRAHARGAGAPAGGARGAHPRLRPRDHDRGDPRPAGAEADPGLGRREHAARLGDRRPRRRDRRQLRADPSGRGRRASTASRSSGC